jgi:hypothetical protein
VQRVTVDTTLTTSSRDKELKRWRNQGISNYCLRTLFTTNHHS